MTLVIVPALSLSRPFRAEAMMAMPMKSRMTGTRFRTPHSTIPSELMSGDCARTLDTAVDIMTRHLSRGETHAEHQSGRSRALNR